MLPLYLDLLRNFPESPNIALVDVLLKNSTKVLI